MLQHYRCMDLLLPLLVLLLGVLTVRTFFCYRREVRSVFPKKYGPWAVVAGGSEGLGRCFVEGLIARGVRGVLVVADDGEQLRKACAEMRAIARPVELYPVEADLGKAEDLRRVCDEIAARDIGLCVVNAAASHIGHFVDSTSVERNQVVDVNVRALLEVVHASVSRMVAAPSSSSSRSGGGVIIMSSLSSLVGSPLLAPYAGSKAFGLVFGESLYAELKPLRIDVLTVVAGAIKTPRYFKTLASHSTNTAPDRAAAVGALSPSEVAGQALDALGVPSCHPVFVPGALSKLASFVMRYLPLRVAVSVMSTALFSQYDRHAQ